jgi:hypothetical protein
VTRSRAPVETSIGGSVLTDRGIGFERGVDRASSIGRR